MNPHDPMQMAGGLTYTSMKVDRGGTPVARFTGKGTIRSVEVEVEPWELPSLRADAMYLCNVDLRTPRSPLPPEGPGIPGTEG